MCYNEGTENAVGTAKQKGKKMSDKMTKREMFENVLGVLTDAGADVVLTDGISHEIDLLDKRDSAKPSKNKNQVANESVKSDILNALAGGYSRAGEIATYCGQSVQKVSALLRQMVSDGDVVRTEDKKVTTFSLN